MYVSGPRLCFVEQAPNCLPRRQGAVAMKPSIVLVTGVKGTIKALFTVWIRRVACHQVGGLFAPIGSWFAAYGFEEIEASHDLEEPGHLALIERIDGLGRLERAERRYKRHDWQ